MPGIPETTPSSDPAEIMALMFNPVSLQTVIFPLFSYLLGIGVLLYDIITFFIAVSNGTRDQYKPVGSRLGFAALNGGVPPPLLQRSGSFSLAPPDPSLDLLSNVLSAISSSQSRFAQGNGAPVATNGLSAT
ncbi:uncharacterized protein LOC108670112 [Hyalella azteca]|uniref:Uncharacterized protein LOC108670112 n=1 Tax=Hyalella azteca TaxID=294128 RepID=A0A8B7NHE4_HYAAZ|nr:uncharacterized protein LOC108670112 [Hyalella azteca]